jgi:hypothetical protein
MRGGKLSARDLKGLIDQSYNKKNEDYGDWKVDKGLSDKEVKVFRHDKTGQVVVAHRGTYSAGDVFLDAQYALGHDISNSRRYKHSADIQRKAEAKYGSENVSTIGHSLGKKLAEVGKNSHEVIGVNGAFNVKDALKPTADNEFNVRSQLDAVSGLSLPKGKNVLTIPSKSANLLEEHSSDVLNRINPDTMIGRGHVKRLSKKDLKEVIKKFPKHKRIPLTNKSKKQLVEHCCESCGLNGGGAPPPDSDNTARRLEESPLPPAPPTPPTPPRRVRRRINPATPPPPTPPPTPPPQTEPADPVVPDSPPRRRARRTSPQQPRVPRNLFGDAPQG